MDARTGAGDYARQPRRDVRSVGAGLPRAGQIQLSIQPRSFRCLAVADSRSGGGALDDVAALLVVALCERGGAGQTRRAASELWRDGDRHVDFTGDARVAEPARG